VILEASLNVEIENEGPIALLSSASRSYLIAGGVLTLVDLGTAAVLLFRRLASMPFPAVTALVAAMFMLAWLWRPALRNNEQMRSFIGGREGGPPRDSETAEMLRMCANLIYGGMFLTALICGLLLLVIIQLFKT